MKTDIKALLEAVRSGDTTVDDALLRLKTLPFEDIGFAKVDLHREVRQGVPEVIFGEGKSADQIAGIIDAMRRNGQSRIRITRLARESAEALAASHGIAYDPVSKTATLGGAVPPDGIGRIVVATGGTSDIPVAEEAAATAVFLGNEVVRLYDVGVAGIHRLMANSETVMSASVIIAVAGMEGALASVIGGMADCPVVAVPTGVGYGASFGGLTALLSMLNSCAAGVSVVNIDNGFGAAYVASKINHMEAKK